MKLPNTRMARDTIRKVNNILSPSDSESAAQALITLVQSGELMALVEFAESVINRTPEAYADRRNFLAAKEGSALKVELKSEGEEFALANYIPVFIGTIHDAT